jgi:hypothetical protein
MGESGRMATVVAGKAAGRQRVSRVDKLSFHNDFRYLIPDFQDLLRSGFARVGSIATSLQNVNSQFHVRLAKFS